MEASCEKNHDVFGFKDEAEVSESTLRIMRKLENPKNTLDQCTFLETGAEQLSHSSSGKLECTAMTDSDDAVITAKQCPESEVELSGSEVIGAFASALPNCSKSNLCELIEAVNMDPHQRGSMHKRSSSTSSDIAENDDDFAGPSSDHSAGGSESENEDTANIVFYPDHIIYRESHFTDSTVTFTSNCITMEAYLAEEDKSFRFQWELEDILNIKSHWFTMFEMAMVTIRVLTKDAIQNEIVECTSGDELKFAVVDIDWYGALEAITSMNTAYKALWSSMHVSEDSLFGDAQVPLKTYFPSFDQPFEEVVYPKGDIDAVSITKRDVDLLQPDTFVNDTIIDFYIKYLKNNIKPEDKHRFHFFNSFFFRKLADPDKDQLKASEGKAAFQRVRKWTRKVNIFEKDYVFIPINYNYHWSLMILCHLGEVATYNGEEVNELAKIPCVLHMDSIRGSHTGLKGLMQSYLKEEWKGRNPEASEEISSRFNSLRFISLELPQQQNSFDCGLFLLHYVELFLKEAPLNFNPFELSKNSHFLNLDWFPPSEASLKRVVIHRLIYDILDHPSPESPAATHGNDHCNLNYPAPDNRKDTAALFFPDKCQSSEADEGVEISIIPSSFTSRQDGGDSSMASRLLFESGSFLNTQFQDLNQTSLDNYESSLPPIQEGVAFAYVPTETTVTEAYQMAPQDPSWNHPLLSVHLPQNNSEPSPDTPVSGCEDSSLVPVNQTRQAAANVELYLMDTTKPDRQVGDGEDLQGPSGSDGSSGLEHPAKKMRMTEPRLDGGFV